MGRHATTFCVRRTTMTNNNTPAASSVPSSGMPRSAAGPKPDLSVPDITKIDLAFDAIGRRVTGVTTHGGHVLDMPLMSEILPGLWMGGCEDGVTLPGVFDFVLSMYPWEKYELHEDVLQRLEIAMYDQRGKVDGDLVLDVAGLVNEWRKQGTVLVHCQAGLNRSGLVTATALVLDGWDPAAAIAHLRDRRGPAVLCNPDFEAWVLAQSGRRSAA